MEVSGQIPATTALAPSEEHRHPLKWRLVRAQNRSGPFREEKNLFPLLEFESRTVQPVV